MARAPRRRKHVYFIGAGLSAAFGLPGTQQLLLGLDEKLESRLAKAYEHFYPIDSSRSKGFRPDVVDFFSLLQSHIAITRPATGAAFPNSPLSDAVRLYQEIKWSIAWRLIDGVRSLDLTDPIPTLDEMFEPGNVIITSNWDFLLEAYAVSHAHRFAYQRRANHADLATVLKLHGSIDWTLARDRKGAYPDSDYARLGQMVGTPGGASQVEDGAEVIRIRALEQLSRAWQHVRARTSEPLMITMAPGKSTELGPLRGLWNDAYWALSSARDLHFIGYSLPANDVEIRALIVAGIERGNQNVRRIHVQNPSPDVHARFRNFVRREIDEDYVPFAW